MKGTRSTVFWLLALILVLMLPVQGHAGAPGFKSSWAI